MLRQPERDTLVRSRFQRDWESVHLIRLQTEIFRGKEKIQMSIHLGYFGGYEDIIGKEEERVRSCS